MTSPLPQPSRRMSRKLRKDFRRSVIPKWWRFVHVDRRRHMSGPKGRTDRPATPTRFFWALHNTTRPRWRSKQCNHFQISMTIGRVLEKASSVPLGAEKESLLPDVVVRRRAEIELLARQGRSPASSAMPAVELHVGIPRCWQCR